MYENCVNVHIAKETVHSLSRLRSQLKLNFSLSFMKDPGKVDSILEALHVQKLHWCQYCTWIALKIGHSSSH